VSGRAAPAPRGRRFWLLHGLLPLLAGAGLVAVLEGRDLDLVLSDACFDFSAGRFPYRHAWWSQRLLHDGGRDLVALTFAAAVATSIAAGASRRLKDWLRPAAYMTLLIPLVTGTVGLAKAASSRHCPWSLARYGGSAPRLGWFEEPPAGLAPGRCFPAAHAAGGFSLLGLYFVFRGRGRALAAGSLALGLSLGTLYAAAQVARGAHFASHGVWSAGIAWFEALALYLAFRARL